MAHRGGSRRGLEARESRERVQRREEHRSISVPPPSPFRHSHFSPRSALHHSASHPPSFVPLSSLLPLASETELLYPPHFANAAAGEQGAAFRPLRHPHRLALLIALSKFITEALVRGLPEFRCRTAVRRYVDPARPLYTKVSPIVRTVGTFR